MRRPEALAQRVLAAYNRVRRLLADELGVEPGAALRTVQQQVLRQSPELAAATRGPVVPGNLPATGPPIVGRADDVAELTTAIGTHRLVTVVGPAGVGKTRLALEVGRHVAAPGGARLDTIEPGDAVPLAQVVTETLHVPVAALHERLTGSGIVLVLDNCEHVVEDTGTFVGSLLSAVPALRMLATSQRPLGIGRAPARAGTAVTGRVGDAVRAAGRARAASVRLDDDTTAAVEQVCRALDGLPLAIELAAARVRSLSVHEISRRARRPHHPAARPEQPPARATAGAGRRHRLES